MWKKRTGLILGLIIVTGFLIGGIFYWRPILQKTAGVSTTAVSPSLSPQASPKDDSQITIPRGKFYAPILMYHHIAERTPQDSYYVSPQTFDEQLKWLKNNNYHIISFDQFYKGAKGEAGLPSKPVVLTFDDGNVDNYTNAFPILKKYSFTATFFIKINSISKSDQGMTWAKLKEMADSGMTIGSHTVNHNDMSKMSSENLKYETEVSKQILEKNLGIEIKYFSYPGGAYSEATIEAVKEAGYLAAVTTQHKVDQEIKNNNSLYTLPRIHIDDEMPTFIDWIQGINLK